MHKNNRDDYRSPSRRIRIDMNDVDVGANGFDFENGTRFKLFVVSKREITNHNSDYFTTEVTDHLFDVDVFTSYYLNYAFSQLYELQNSYLPNHKQKININDGEEICEETNASILLEHVNIRNINYWLKYYSVLSNIRYYLNAISILEKAKTTTIFDKSKKDHVRELINDITRRDARSDEERIYEKVVFAIETVLSKNYGTIVDILPALIVNSKNIGAEYDISLKKDTFDEEDVCFKTNVVFFMREYIRKMNEVVDNKNNQENHNVINKKSEQYRSNLIFDSVFNDPRERLNFQMGPSRFASDSNAENNGDDKYRTQATNISDFANMSKPSAPAIEDDDVFYDGDNVFVDRFDNYKKQTYRWFLKSKYTQLFLKLYARLFCDKNKANENRTDDFSNHLIKCEHWVWHNLFLNVCDKTLVNYAERLMQTNPKAASCFNFIYDFDAFGLESEGRFLDYKCVLENHAELSFALYRYFSILKKNERPQKENDKRWMDAVSKSFRWDHCKNLDFSEECMNWGLFDCAKKSKKTTELGVSDTQSSSSSSFEDEIIGFKDAKKSEQFRTVGEDIRHQKSYNTFGPSNNDDTDAKKDEYSVFSSEWFASKLKTMTHNKSYFEKSFRKKRQILGKMCEYDVELSNKSPIGDLKKLIDHVADSAMDDMFVANARSNPTARYDPTTNKTKYVNLFRQESFDHLVVYCKKSYQTLYDMSYFYEKFSTHSDAYVDRYTANNDNASFSTLNSYMILCGIYYQQLQNRQVKRVKLTNNCTECSGESKIFTDADAQTTISQNKCKMIMFVAFVMEYSKNLYTNRLLHVSHTLTEMTISTRTSEYLSKMDEHETTQSLFGNSAFAYTYEKMIYSILFNSHKINLELTKKNMSQHQEFSKWLSCLFFNLFDVVSPHFYKFYVVHNSTLEATVSKERSFLEQISDKIDYAIYVDGILKDFDEYSERDTNNPHANYSRTLMRRFKTICDVLKTGDSIRLVSGFTEYMIASFQRPVVVKKGENANSNTIDRMLSLGISPFSVGNFKFLMDVALRTIRSIACSHDHVIVPYVACRFFFDHVNANPSQFMVSHRMPTSSEYRTKLANIYKKTHKNRQSDICALYDNINTLMVYVASQCNFKKYEKTSWGVASTTCKIYLSKQIATVSETVARISLGRVSIGDTKLDDYSNRSASQTVAILAGDVKMKTSNRDEQKMIYKWTIDNNPNLGIAVDHFLRASIVYIACCIKKNSNLKDILRDFSNGATVDYENIYDKYSQKLDTLRASKSFLNSNPFGLTNLKIVNDHVALVQHSNAMYDIFFSHGRSYDQCVNADCLSSNTPCLHLKNYKSTALVSVVDFNYDAQMYVAATTDVNHARYCDNSNVFYSKNATNLPYCDILKPQSEASETTIITRNIDQTRISDERLLKNRYSDAELDANNNARLKLCFVLVFVGEYYNAVRHNSKPGQKTLLLSSTAFSADRYLVAESPMKKPKVYSLKSQDSSECVLSDKPYTTIERASVSNEAFNLNYVGFNLKKNYGALSVLRNIVAELITKNVNMTDVEAILRSLNVEDVIDRSEMFDVLYLQRNHNKNDDGDDSSFMSDEAMFTLKPGVLNRPNILPNIYDWSLLYARLFNVK